MAPELAYDVWRDERSIETDWSAQIAGALTRSDAVLLMWSARAAASKWVLNEWLTARALEKPIIPVLLAREPTLPLALENLQAVLVERGADDLRKRVDAYLTSPPVYDFTVKPQNTRIPLNPNPNFVGRQGDLVDLYLAVLGNLNKTGIRAVGIVGMGGVGKTQLAVEFAYRFAFAFEGVFWIQANDPESWLTQFVELARALPGVGGIGPLPTTERGWVLALQQYCNEHPQTLIVMDNVNDPLRLNDERSLRGVAPLNLGCNLLFTTRTRVEIPGVTLHTVTTLSESEAYSLVASAREPRDDQEQEDLKAICRAVGYLPLALVLIAAYLKKYVSFSLADYLRQLSLRRLETVDVQNLSEAELATRHVAAVEATLETQWASLESENARRLFVMAGLLPEGAVPKQRLGLLTALGQKPDDLVRPLDDAVILLVDLSLAEEYGGGNALRLHPLVHDFAKSRVADPDSERKQGSQRIAAAYSDFARLEDEWLGRGTPEVMEDIQIAMSWGGGTAGYLHGLERTLDRTADQLARWDKPPNAAFFAQELHNRAVTLGATEVVAAARSQLATVACPQILLRWRTDRNSAALLRTLRGHTSWVTAVAVSPDNRRAVSAGRDGFIKIWDIDTGRELESILIQPELDLWTVAFSLTGHQIIAPDQASALTVWDADTGQERMKLRGHEGTVHAIVPFPQGNRVVSAADDSTLRVWDLDAEEQVASLALDSPGVAIAAISEKQIAVLDFNGEVRFLRLDPPGELERLAQADPPTDSYGTALAIDRAGRRVVTNSGDSVALWDRWSGGAPQILRGHGGTVFALAISEDGRRALSGSEDRSIILWDLETATVLKTYTGHDQPVTSLALIGADRAISASADQTLMVWDLNSEEPANPLVGHEYAVNGVALSPDGARAASASTDSNVKTWNATAGQLLGTCSGHSGWVTDVTLANAGRLTVSAGLDKTIRVWDTETGRGLDVLDGHKDWIRSIAAMPDGSTVVSTSKDRTVRLWSLHGIRGASLLKAIHSLISNESSILDTLDAVGEGIPVCVNGSRIAIGTGDAIVVWDLLTKRRIAAIRGSQSQVMGIAITPDSRRVLANCQDGTVLVWDIGEPRFRTIPRRRAPTWEPGSAQPAGIAALPDNQHALRTRPDQALEILDIFSSSEAGVTSFDHMPLSLALSEDGSTVVVGDWAGDVHCFEITRFPVTRP